MKLKVSIVNETVWPTSMLRPFIIRAAREEFDGSTKNRQPRHLRVYLKYTRGNESGCTGHAYYGSGTSQINVPFPGNIWDRETARYRKRKLSDPPMRFPVADFVATLIHEFGHNVGLHHKQSRQLPRMTGRYYKFGRAASEEAFPWQLALPVPILKTATKPSTDQKRMLKLVAAQDAVKRWERKTKLAKTKLVMWQRKVRALERTLEKAATTLHENGESDAEPSSAHHQPERS